MKTLMIIGAGFGQLPAITKAKEMGIRTIVIDKNKDANGMQFADIALPVDVVDFDEAIKIAKRFNIDGVMTMQTDLPVPTIGAVVDALKLNGVTLEVANDCSNKIKTRVLFAARNVPQPLFQVVASIDQAQSAVEKIGIPCVIKAPDSSGSRGVTKINDKNEIENALLEARKYSRVKQALVEEFIDGLEIGAQAYSINGKCVKVLLHNDTLSKPPHMIPIGHSFPIYMDDKKIAIAEKAVAEAVEALGINNGPSNVDLIIDKENNIKVIEIGARIGATCLPELVEYFTGIDWVKASINSALNQIPNLTEIKNQPVAAIIIESPKDGIFQGFEIPDVLNENKDILEIEITAKSGDQVNTLKKGTDRIGKVVCIGKTASEAEKLAMEVRNSIKIHVS